MDIERKNSTFIRDILVKLVLIILFVFLLTLLFPMPNLATFYDAVFNDNVQKMKDAADSYFTTERMPKEVGDEEKLTLQQMLDKKIILPFVDKEGKDCSTTESYVSVKKEETEYTLKVYLSCGSKSDYIIEPIGCYNFCPNGNCTNSDIKTDEKTGEVTVKEQPSNAKYKTQYLYTRTIKGGNWVLGDYQDNKLSENKDVKVSDTRVVYTGQKKVTSGTTLYKHVLYAWRDRWSTITKWTDEVKKLTDKIKIYDTRVVYTGQKKITKGSTLYKHIKYAWRDKWTYDTEWTDEVKKETDNLKLYDTRTLYTGQKKEETKVTLYKHEKWGWKDNWKELDWSTTKRTTSSTVVLIGTRYTVRKTVKKVVGKWSSWVEDTTWRTSKPADTATKQWSGPSKTKITTTWKTINNSYASYGVTLPTYSGNRWNEFLYSQMETCTKACNGKSQIRVYYYRIHEKVNTYQYLYLYRTYSESSSITTDEKVVTDPTSYVKNGYTIVKTEYKYKINNREKYLIDTKWTESKTSPAGYKYANQRKTRVTIHYINLGKWVTSKDKLGEYTYNIRTRVQYKYKYNNPEKYIEDIAWTSSITPPKGYEYTGESKTETSTTYEDLGKWVTSKKDLGDYTYNIRTKTQYKYQYNEPEKYIKDTIWTTNITPPVGYEYTGENKTETKTSYADLGKWVTSKKDLGDYTYNIQTKTQYRYKFYNSNTKTESKWFDKNPGGDWVYANQTRRVKIN